MEKKIEAPTVGKPEKKLYSDLSRLLHDLSLRNKPGSDGQSQVNQCSEITGTCFKNLEQIDRIKAHEHLERGIEHFKGGDKIDSNEGYYNSLREYNAALDEFSQAKEIVEKKLGKGHSDAAPILQMMGFVYSAQGTRHRDYEGRMENFKKAEQCLHDALDGYLKEVSNLQYKSIAKTLDGLERLYNEKRFRNKTDVIKQLKETFASHDEPEKIAELLKKLGMVYRDQAGKFEYAERYLKKACAMYQESPDLSAENCYTKDPRYQLGILYRKWRRFKDAKKEFHDADPEGNSPEILRELAIVHVKTKEFEKAEEFALKALHGPSEGDRHNTAETLHLLSSIDLELGNNEDAARYALQELEIKKDNPKSNDCAIANSLLRLGIAFDKLGKGEEANKCFEEMFSLRRDVLELGYPENRSYVDHLIEFYKRRNDNEKTKQLLQDVLLAQLEVNIVSENKLGLENKVTRDDLNCLLTFYKEQNDFAGVKQVIDGIAIKSEKKLGFDHWEIKRMLYYGAKFFADNKQPQYAIDLWVRAVNRRNDKLGPNNTETQLCRETGVQCLEGLGFDQNQLEQIRRAIGLKGILASISSLSQEELKIINGAIQKAIEGNASIGKQ